MGSSRQSPACVVGLVLLLRPGPVLSQASGSDGYRQTVLAIQEKIQAQDLGAAETLLAAAQAKYPRDGGLDNLWGVVAVQEEKPETARKAFAQAIHLSPKLVAAYLNLARLDAQFADPAKASSRQESLDLYRQVLALDPSNAEANIESANLLLAADKAPLARDRLEALQPEAKASVRAQALLCGVAAAEGNKTQATAAASGLAFAADLREEDVEAALPGLLAGRRADLVERLLTAVASRTALSAHDERLLGLAEEAEGKLPAARATLEQAYGLDPSSAATLADLARVAAAERKDQDALGYLAHARALSPKNAAFAFSFGVICSRLNLLGEAQKTIGEALALNPENPHYLLSMSKVTILSQNSLDALPYLERFRRLRSDDAEGKLLTGVMYFRAKDFEHAEPWLKQAVASPEFSSSAELYLGSIARQQDRPEEALGLLQIAEKEQPQDAQTHAELGLTFLQLKQYEEAEPELNRAVALDAMNYEANFGLVRLYAHSNDPRRLAQARRFEEVKNQREEYAKQAMRVVEVQSGDAFPMEP